MTKFPKYLIALAFLMLAASACYSPPPDSTNNEATQQAPQLEAIVNNQPAHNFGGHSAERQILIDSQIARNQLVPTWTYVVSEYSNYILELCPSIGYPIPYATQLTNPMKVLSFHAYGGGYDYFLVPNPEPNSLFPPASADATWVACVNADGSVTPQYFETKVAAFAYRIKSDRQIERTDNIPLAWTATNPDGSKMVVPTPGGAPITPTAAPTVAGPNPTTSAQLTQVFQSAVETATALAPK